MGSVAMGTFRVDVVYKLGAVCWLIPAIDLLYNTPDYNGIDMDRLMSLLGYSQAFAFVRVCSPVSFFLIRTVEGLGIELSEVKSWDVACRIVWHSHGYVPRDTNPSLLPSCYSDDALCLWSYAVYHQRGPPHHAWK